MLKMLYPLLKSLHSGLESVNREIWYKNLCAESQINWREKEFNEFFNDKEEVIPKEINYGDRIYEVLNYDEFIKWLKDDDTSDLVYVKTRRECNAFADVLKGRVREIGNFAVGTAWGYVSWLDGYHAFNVFYAKENGIMKWYALEPQTDKIYSIFEVKSIRFLTF